MPAEIQIRKKTTKFSLLSKKRTVRHNEKGAPFFILLVWKLRLFCFRVPEPP